MAKNCRIMRFQFLETTIDALHLGIVTDNKSYLVGNCLDQITVAGVWPQRGTKTMNKEHVAGQRQCRSQDLMW